MRTGAILYGPDNLRCLWELFAETYTMNRRIAAVLAGYLRLSDTDQSALVEELNRYIRGDQPLRKSITESVRAAEKMELGPSQGGCPCCGR